MHLATYSHTAKRTNSWRGGILPRLVWVPALGVKPIAHLLSDTNYHSTKVIYNTSEILRTRLRSQSSAPHENITTRTLSNSSVSITVTYLRLRIILVFLPQNYPHNFFVTISIIPYHQYPSRNLILPYLLSHRLYYYNTHG